MDFKCKLRIGSTLMVGYYLNNACCSQTHSIFSSRVWLTLSLNMNWNNTLLLDNTEILPKNILTLKQQHYASFIDACLVALAVRSILRDQSDTSLITFIHIRYKPNFYDIIGHSLFIRSDCPYSMAKIRPLQHSIIVLYRYRIKALPLLDRNERQYGWKLRTATRAEYFISYNDMANVILCVFVLVKHAKKWYFQP